MFNVFLLKFHLLALLLKLFMSARIRAHRTTGPNYPCRFLSSTVFVYASSPMFFSTLIMFSTFITPSHFSCVESLLSCSGCLPSLSTVRVSPTVVEILAISPIIFCAWFNLSVYFLAWLSISYFLAPTSHFLAFSLLYCLFVMLARRLHQLYSLFIFLLKLCLLAASIN